MLDVEKTKIQRYLELKGINPEGLTNRACYLAMIDEMQPTLMELFQCENYSSYIPASNYPKFDEYKFYMWFLDCEIARMEKEKREEKRFKIVKIVKRVQDKILLKRQKSL